MRISGTSYYYIPDYQGSVVALTDNTGVQLDTFAYDPFGNLIYANGVINEPFGYTGADYDGSTGLYHLGARFYSPGQARFTQLDPSGQNPGDVYTGDNPVNFSDPSGKANCGLVGIAGFVGGGIAGGLGGLIFGPGAGITAAVGAVGGGLGAFGGCLVSNLFGGL